VYTHNNVCQRDITNTTNHRRWASGAEAFSFHSGHENNVFQAHEMPASGGAMIVSCAADGQVRVARLHPGGGTPAGARVGHHAGRAHRLALLDAHAFLSCGEDGDVLLHDLREAPGAPGAPRRRRALLTSPSGALFSIAAAPRRPELFATGGEDEWARVYDLRYAGGAAEAAPLRRVAPPHLAGTRGRVHCAGVAWSRAGDLLASYNDEGAYLLAGEAARERAPADSSDSGGSGGMPPLVGEELGGAPARGGGGGGGGEAMPPLASESDAGAASMDASGESGSGSGSGWITNSGSEEEDMSEDEDEEAAEEDEEDVSEASGSGRCSASPPPLVEDEETDGGGASARARAGSGAAAAAAGDPVLAAFRGHRNQQTVKGAAFLGERDDWVCAGSDDGRLYIWCASSGRLAAVLKGDRHVVNCVEPHPFLPMTLASGGIDDSVKVWEPTAAARRPLSVRDARRARGNRARQEAA
jgi:hypothetical protein